MQRIDPRQILTGSDGELYSDDGVFLAQVNTFNSEVEPITTTYMPAGSRQEVTIITGYRVTLTLEEIVVRDEMLNKVLTALRNGEPISLGFMGVVRGRNGKVQRVVYRGCVPNGTIGLQSVSPGEIIRRSWTFAVNDPPDLQSLLI